MARIFRLVFILIVFSALAASTETIAQTGWISDSKCGAKMQGYCARSCIAAGEKPVFVTEDKHVIAIANPEMTKGYEGEHVLVKGSVDAGILTISTIGRTTAR